MGFIDHLITGGPHIVPYGSTILEASASRNTRNAPSQPEYPHCFAGVPSGANSRISNPDAPPGSRPCWKVVGVECRT